MSEEDVTAIAAKLREAGYLVVKIPVCKLGDHGHGRHSLITRSAMCEGRDPIPHAFLNGYFGSFGWICICACGDQFNDYTFDGEGPSPWKEHVAEYQIDMRPRHLRS